MGSVAFRAFVSGLGDFSSAGLAGLLLAYFWTRAPEDRRKNSSRDTPWPALLYSWVPALCLAGVGALQLLSLSAVFAGATSLHEILQAMPDVLQTLPGRVLAYALAAATALALLTSFLRFVFIRRIKGTHFHAAGRSAATDSNVATGAEVDRTLSFACVAVFAVYLAFRAGTGHAAAENVFSLSHILQFAHLAAMAVWSGGILVSGFWLLPRLRDSAAFVRYLRSLSRYSTFSFAVTVLSGASKAWFASTGHLRLDVSSGWGRVLIIKIVLVCVAVALGYSNRRRLGFAGSAVDFQSGRAVAVLRAEAIVMAAILALSAVLGTLPPPEE